MFISASFSNSRHTSTSLNLVLSLRGPPETPLRQAYRVRRIHHEHVVLPVAQIGNAANELVNVILNVVAQHLIRHTGAVVLSDRCVCLMCYGVLVTV